MKKTLFLTVFAAATLTASADLIPNVSTNEGGSSVWTDVTITPENQSNYLDIPGTPGNHTFSGAVAAWISIGDTQGKGSLTIDGGKLVSPNCFFIAGGGNNGKVTVTNGGSLTVAGCTWTGDLHNPTAAGAQLVVANTSGEALGTLDITNGGQVHANARTAIGGGNCTGVVNISGEGSVLDCDLRGETQDSQVHVYIGYNGNGNGTVNVKDGALFSANATKATAMVLIGAYGNATGTLNVDNATANLGRAAWLGYADNTSGTIKVTNGGYVYAPQLVVGNTNTSSGTLVVDATSTFIDLTILNNSVKMLPCVRKEPRQKGRGNI